MALHLIHVLAWHRVHKVELVLVSAGGVVGGMKVRHARFAQYVRSTVLISINLLA